MSERSTGWSVWKGYSSEGDHPLGAYALLLMTFSSLFAALLGITRMRRRSLPARIAPADVALLGVATYRLSRLLTKDSVTAVFRAPFTTFARPTGNGEVEEKPRGTGIRHALGELAVCPFCVGQWVAAFFTFGLVLAPRFTRLIAGLFSVYTVSDVLQLGYEAAKRRVLQMPEMPGD